MLASGKEISGDAPHALGLDDEKSPRTPRRKEVNRAGPPPGKKKKIARPPAVRPASTALPFTPKT